MDMTVVKFKKSCHMTAQLVCLRLVYLYFHINMSKGVFSILYDSIPNTISFVSLNTNHKSLYKY